MMKVGFGVAGCRRGERGRERERERSGNSVPFFLGFLFDLRFFLISDVKKLIDYVFLLLKIGVWDFIN